MVQVFIQILPLSPVPVSTLPPMLIIYAVLCIPFAVKSRRFTSYFKETFLCAAIKESDGMGIEGVWGMVHVVWGVFLFRECRFFTAYKVIKQEKL
jgi:hypothetical protein